MSKILSRWIEAGIAGRGVKQNSADAYQLEIEVSAIKGLGFSGATVSDTLEVLVNGTTMGFDGSGNIRINDGSITASLITNATITGAKIASATITGSNVAATTITGSNLVNNTVTATQIAANTITASEIAANTITAGQIAANTITATQIAAATITASEIANLTITGAKIANDTITATQIDETGAFTWTGAHSFTTITVPAVPAGANAPTSKTYVDNLVSGIDWKESVRALTTAALPAVTYNNGASGVGATLTATANGALPAQDGVTLVVGNRFLVRNQAAGLQNGIYTVTDVGSAGTPFILTRAVDFDDSPVGEVSANNAAFVEEGTNFADTGWTLVTDNPITIGTTAIAFTQFTGLGSIIAGAGISQTGATLAVEFTTNKGLQFSGGGNTGGDSETLEVKVDASTINFSSGALYVPNSGITETQLNTSVAGNGLSGGGGSALAVNVDDSTIEINADTLRVKDLGITTSKLAATSVTAAKLGSDVAGAGLAGGNGSAIDVVAADSSITVNADSLQVQVAAAGAISVGTGIQVNVDNSTIEINTNALRVKTSGNFTWTGAHTFTGGTITVPTQTVNNNTTSAASTAFVTAQIAASVGTQNVDYVTLNGTNITNKYVDLVAIPKTAAKVVVDVVGGTAQAYATDFTVITDGTDIKRLNWDTLGMDGQVVSGTVLRVVYWS